VAAKSSPKVEPAAQPLGQYSDEQLLAELTRRCQEVERVQLAARRQRNKDLFAQLDTLLLLMPKHNTSYCSDGQLKPWLDEVYGQIRCVRCVLLECREMGSIPDALRFELNKSCVTWDTLPDPDAST